MRSLSWFLLLSAMSSAAACSSSSSSSSTPGGTSGDSSDGGAAIDGASADAGASTSVSIAGGGVSDEDAQFVDGFLMHDLHGKPELHLSTVSGAGTACTQEHKAAADQKLAIVFLPPNATAGVYALPATNGSATSADLVIFDVANCVSGNPSSVSSASGTLTIDAIGAAGARGHFDAKLGDAMMSGDFDVSGCDAIDYGTDPQTDAGPPLACAP